MSPERWGRIEELCHAALARPAQDRVHFLEQECGGDSALRREVESLLSQRDTAPQTATLSQAGGATARTRLDAGAAVGPYCIEDLLGAGAMGEVYRARDTRLGRLVALKRLHPDALRDPQRRGRFLQEARTASALNHPNIVTFYDLVAADGEDFLVLEHVAGKTLDRVIPRRGLPVRDAVGYAAQIADALAAAHAAGVIHRDIKPANIIVTEKGTVKLLDFGLAKLVDGEPTDATATATGVILGTFSYMSPEQAEAKPADARSDIFSFGCVLYEMLTGQRAFRAESPAAAMSAILRDDPQRPVLLRPDVPPDVEKIVLRCLRKDANRRFQHADDLKVALLDALDEVAPGPAAAESGPKPSRSWRAAMAAVAVAAVFGGLFLYRQIAVKETPSTITPMTSYAGYELDPAFSPDANQIAFEWDGERRDNSDIYVKLVGPGEPLRLTTDPARDHSPSWSPDGRWIAFVRELPENRAAVFLVPALGGAERKLADTTSSYLEFSYLGSRTLTWTPDGKALAVTDRGAPGEPFGIFLFSAETGERRRLTSPPPGATDRSPAISADSRMLAFSRSVAVQSSDLYILPLTADLRPNGEPQPLTADHRWNDSPVWLDRGGELLFSSNRDGPQGLWRMHASVGSEPRRAPLGADGLMLPAVSRERRRLIYVQRFQDSNLWTLPLADSGRNRATPHMLVSSSRLDANGDYSPDGRHIAFQSDRSGSYEIWICDRDGSHARQLTSYGHGHTGTPRWSPDGKWIAFDSNVDGQFQIYLIRPDGGAPRRLTEGPDFNAIPSWSRDGKWIYFNSRRGGGNDIWKAPAEGGAAIQVTTDGGLVASESPDGRVVYYLKGAVPAGGEYPLWQMPSGGGAARMVIPAVAIRNFVVSEQGVYYARFEQREGWSMRLFRPETGTDVVILRHFTQPDNGLSISPDGRELLYTQIDQEGSDLMLVENFR